MNEFLGLCAIGTESVLNNELKLNGFKQTKKFPGRVFFTPVDSNEDILISMFKANYFLRIPDKIGLVISSFVASDFDALFDGIYSLEWQDYFKKDVRIVIDKVITSKSTLSSEHAVQSVAHKAIYKKLSEKWKILTLPETGDTFSIRVYLEDNKAFIILDLSGEPLHKRGYRLLGGIAPIRETLASALLQFMHWKRKIPLHDPFCGSGTIPIEATLYAYNIPPGIMRHFLFEKLSCFDHSNLNKILFSEKGKAIRNINTDCLVRITGSDISDESIEIAEQNAEMACSGVENALKDVGCFKKLGRPEFIQASIDELSAPYNEGCIIGNPPYGERIGDEQEALELYNIIAKLPRSFRNWNFGFITNKKEFSDIIRRKNPRLTIKSRVLKGGKLDTCFYIY